KLAVAVHGAVIRELVRDARLRQAALHRFEIRLVITRQVAGGVEADRRAAGLPPEDRIRLGEPEQSLFGRDPREIAHAKDVIWFRAALIALQVDAERHDRDAILWNPQQLRHRRHVVPADGDEVIDLAHL